MLFLIFSISLVPGMFGGKLGELDAYIPLAGGSSGPSASGENPLVWMKNQYRAALDRARRERKLVLVNFTGYACTNCHWMKANMFTRPEVAGALRNFVLVELYTDGTDDASRVNQELQQTKFATIAIPYYAILDPDENVVASFPGLTRDPAEYLAFLGKSGAGKAAQSDLAGLTITRLEGGSFDDAALQGKVVVVDFWATWCVPCIKEIPGFNRLNDELGGSGVVVLGVDMDEDGGAPLVESFLKDHPMKYRVVLGSPELKERFHVNSLPTTVVFDRSGKALQRFEGFTKADLLESAVKTAL
jgi:thiol:disulfide interchange protein DsbD